MRETDAAWWMEDDRLFMLLLPECGTDAALQTGTRIVRDLSPQVSGDLRFGVAEFPKDGLAFKDLLEHAGDFLVKKERQAPRDTGILGIANLNA
jgi:hypothetical protein